jgi:hypothetical protein
MTLDKKGVDLAERAIRHAEQLEAKLNDPDALRARLAELEASEAEQARREVREAIASDPDAFNEAVDRRNPKVMAIVNRALKAGE